MTTAIQIALQRAKMVLRSNITRAVEILVRAGFAMADAARYLLAVKRAGRTA